MRHGAPHVPAGSRYAISDGHAVQHGSLVRPRFSLVVSHGARRLLGFVARDAGQAGDKRGDGNFVVGPTCTAECRFAIALRVLAGASYLDVMLDFGVGRSTVFHLFKQVRILRLSVRRGE